MKNLTVSEKFFENACQRKSWKCKRLKSTSESKSYDFDVTIADVKIAVEIKEFTENRASCSLEKTMKDTSAGKGVVTEPEYRGGRLASKMNDASKQFQQSASGSPSLLVLQDVSVHGMRDWDAFLALSSSNWKVPDSKAEIQRQLAGAILEDNDPPKEIRWGEVKIPIYISAVAIMRSPNVIATNGVDASIAYVFINHEAKNSLPEVIINKLKSEGLG